MYSKTWKQLQQEKNRGSLSTVVAYAVFIAFVLFIIGVAIYQSHQTKQIEKYCKNTDPQYGCEQY